jgi:hypothetical protein
LWSKGTHFLCHTTTQVVDLYESIFQLFNCLSLCGRNLPVSGNPYIFSMVVCQLLATSNTNCTTSGTVIKTLVGGSYDDAFAISTVPVVKISVTLAQPLSNFYMRIGFADEVDATQPIVGYGVYGNSLRCGATSTISSSCGWYNEELASLEAGDILVMAFNETDGTVRLVRNSIQLKAIELAERANAPLFAILSIHSDGAYLSDVVLDVPPSPNCTALVLSDDHLLLQGWNATLLADLRATVQRTGVSSLPAMQTMAANELQRHATNLLALDGGSRCLDSATGNSSAGPWSVVNKPETPPSGEKRDFMTISTYHWPCNAECPDEIFGTAMCVDWWTTPGYWNVTLQRSSSLSSDGPFPPVGCNNQTGEPWIPHDGFPTEAGQRDGGCLIVMAEAAVTLALGSFIFDDDTFGEAAARVLRAWFVDEATSMLPRMQHGAMIPGALDGTANAIGFTSIRFNTALTDAEKLLVHGGVANWTSEDRAAFRCWNLAYLDFLRTSDFGGFEAASPANHGTFYHLHAIALALSTSQPDVATELARPLASGYVGSLNNQVAADGEMPLETARADSATYSMMNLRGMYQLAKVAAQTNANEAKALMFHEEVGTGQGSLRRALDFMLPYATNASATWPFPQGTLVDGQISWWILARELRMAALTYENGSVSAGNCTAGPVNWSGYEDCISRLNWPDGQWPALWHADVVQLLYPWPRLDGPTGEPGNPSQQPTLGPTGVPTPAPTKVPTALPTANPTPGPTWEPTGQPTEQPSGQPSAQLYANPTPGPTGVPTLAPIGQPSGTQALGAVYIVFIVIFALGVLGGVARVVHKRMMYSKVVPAPRPMMGIE